jgi:ABC-2 type transport system ATP-binding protein
VISVRNVSHRYGPRAALSGVSFEVEKAGVVFQTQSLDRHLTVDENLRAQGHLYGLAGQPLRERIQAVTGRLGLQDRLRDMVGELSGGLKRRVEIAKALLHRPQVLLMDEASTGLDPRARRELWNYVAELRRTDGVTILLTTHVLDEADRCDRLVLLHQGEIVSSGRPAELKSKIGGDVVVLAAVEPSVLAPQIRSRFGVEPSLVDGTLRVEIGNGHRFITEVVEAFPGAIESVGLHKPTLEDVFVHETGARIE